MSQLERQNPLLPLMQDLENPKTRLDEYIGKWAGEKPNEIAAICNDISIDYKKLENQINKFANYLYSIGLRDNDIIAVLIAPSIEFLIIFMACSRLGLCWLGLNPKYTTSEMEYVIKDANPKLILAKKQIGKLDYKDLFAEIIQYQDKNNAGFEWLDGVFFDGFSENINFPKPINSIAALVYTSGTTGNPKAAKLSHKSLINAAITRAKVWDIIPFRTINNVPINHVGALGDICCTSIIKGGCQVFLETFSAQETIKAIEKHKITYWYQAPTMFEMCLNEQEKSNHDLSSLKAIIWSGGRASQNLIDKMSKYAGLLAVDYSMTESVGPLSMTPLTKSSEMKEGTIGWPIPNRNIRLCDPVSNKISENEISGEVQIKDEFGFCGYRNLETGFSDDGWFKTGDLVDAAPNGEWELVGRCKEMFKSGGYNIYPREIEMALEKHSKINAAAVIEIPDEIFGEVGHAFIATFFDDLSEKEVIEYARSMLANYKIPKKLTILKTLPMLPIGKVDKIALRKLV
ncbi:MAG: acyl--CoA ligase [Caulobacterales bacterium]|nr:acyl--CoA ligase [Caulobacterales bacterium]